MKNVKIFAVVSLLFSIIGAYLFMIEPDYRSVSKVLLGIGTVSLFLTLYYALKSNRN